MDKSKLAEKLHEIAEKFVEKLSIELVHIEIVNTSHGQTVRVFIDKENGVTHEDCSAVSFEIEKILDEKDLIPNAYTLEVSSPGIERGLYRLKDFEKFVDNLAKIRTHSAINGQRNFSGKIIKVRGEEIVFDDKTNGMVEIPFDFIKKANLEFDLEEELKQAKKRN